MQYYQCGKYPIEFVLSENIDKHFDSHYHVEHYVISVVMQGTVTVSRIAAEMGFYDQSHFDKAFQRIVGISPSEYVHSKKQIAQDT